MAFSLKRMVFVSIMYLSVFNCKQVLATISLLTENSTVTADSTAILTCVVETDNPATTIVRWEKDGIDLTSSSKVTVYNRQVEDVEFSYAQTTVEVCDVAHEDGGEYACVTVDGAMTTRRSTYLNVANSTVPAVIVALSSNDTIVVHSSSLLTCVAYGVPAPTIRWERDGDNLLNSSLVTMYETQFEKESQILTQSTLELCGVQITDTGDYTCVAESGDTLDRRTIQLEIITDRVPADIIAMTANDTVQIYSTTLLTCVGHGVPTPSIQWLKDGTTLANTSLVTIYETQFVKEPGRIFVQSTLELCGVLLTDSGEYTCIVENDDSSRTMATQLTVTDNIVPADIIAMTANDTVLIHSTTLLTCVGHGVPTPSIQWQKDGTTLANTSLVTIYETQFVKEPGRIFVQSTLELCGVLLMDSGEYTCIVENEDSSRTMATQLKVTDNNEPAQVILLSSNTTVDVQTTVFLTCVGYGVPTATVTWEKEGLPLTNNTQDIYIRERVVLKEGKDFTQSTLELCNIQPYQAGMYTCTVESGSTTHALSTEVVIIGNATIDMPTMVTLTTAEETTTEDTTEEPTTTEETTEEQTTTEETTEEPTTNEEMTEEPTTTEETTEEPTTNEEMTEEPTTTEETTEEPTTTEETTEEPTTTEETTEEPTTTEETTEEPTTTEETTEEPTTTKETTEEPTTTKEMTVVYTTKEETTQAMESDTTQMMACTEPFKLLLGPINNCLDWKFSEPISKADLIFSYVIDELTNPLCSPVNPEFLCVANYQQSVLLKADISGEGGCNCNMAVQELAAWVGEGASILVEANRLNIDSNCNIQATVSNGQLECSNNQVTDPANVGESDNSRFIIIGASGGIVLIVIILFIMCIVGALIYKAKKRKSCKMMKKVVFSSTSLAEWDPQPDPPLPNKYVDTTTGQSKPGFQEASTAEFEPVYNVIGEALEEKEKYQALIRRESTTNAYELDYEMSTFGRNTLNRMQENSEAESNMMNDNEPYVIMNPGSA